MDTGPSPLVLAKLKVGEVAASPCDAMDCPSAEVHPKGFGLCELEDVVEPVDAAVPPVGAGATPVPA